MKPLVSVMIPSRKRVNKLNRTLQQLADTATDTNFEVLIRIDDDDIESQSAAESWQKLYGAKVFVGKRLGGYCSLDSQFYRELEENASGTFVWIAGDDMLVYGDWFGELSKVPTTGFIVQPEISRLRESSYHRAEAQAFPIFPRFCWKQFTDEFPRPFDVNGSNLLLSNGCKTWFLNGVTMWHDRASDEEIEEHRKV